jgi:hypothetical protein
MFIVALLILVGLECLLNFHNLCNFWFFFKGKMNFFTCFSFSFGWEWNFQILWLQSGSKVCQRILKVTFFGKQQSSNHRSSMIIEGFWKSSSWLLLVNKDAMAQYKGMSKVCYVGLMMEEGDALEELRCLEPMRIQNFLGTSCVFLDEHPVFHKQKVPSTCVNQLLL